MRVPCQAGCGKEVDLSAADAHKLYIALRRPDFREAELDVCSPECATTAGTKMLASIIPPKAASAPAPATATPPR